jgi:hypothetical protein
VRRKIEEGVGWRPGAITHFRDQAQAGPGLDAALKTLRSLVPDSSPPTETKHTEGTNGNAKIGARSNNASVGVVKNTDPLPCLRAYADDVRNSRLLPGPAAESKIPGEFQRSLRLCHGSPGDRGSYEADPSR